jgi:membrane-bound lytic murein transglycosylase D
MMRHSINYVKIKFGEIKTKKILLFLCGAICILNSKGYADFEKINFPSTHTNSLTQPNLEQFDYNHSRSITVEAAIIRRSKENKVDKQFYNKDILSGESFANPEKYAQQKMKKALELCHMSQEHWQNGDLEQAIELLDQAYLLILQIDSSGSERLMRQKEDLRLTISKRIIEIYASKKVFTYGSQNEIPMVINKQVQYEIDLYTNGDLRNHFIASYRRSGKYRQMMVEMLKKEDLPQDLSWLPLIESGFRVKALSKSRALGLWQFIPSTGYRFGLNRNRFIDERLDPEKSTQAAIGYLKKLHGHFGDWTTALAAYNCGETRVLNVIKKQKINYLDNFWDLYAHLPQETARYVPKFLATLHIVKNLEKYGLDKIAIESPVKSESLTVTQKLHLEDIAKITGIDKELLEELNPELRQNIVPGGKVKLKVPAGSKKILHANIDHILRLNPARVDFLKHRVQSGETLSLIAHRYRTSVSNIMLANNLRRPNHIVTGKTLKIPQKIKTTRHLKTES